jgi:hypothetical protein
MAAAAEIIKWFKPGVLKTKFTFIHFTVAKHSTAS